LILLFVEDDMNKSNQENYETIETINAESLLNRMTNWPDLLVINVLDEKTFNDCHIKGTVNIPYDQLESRLKDFDRAREIIVYCASHICSASKQAYALLKKMGFVRVWAYEGGIKEWHAEGLPTEGSCKMEYLKE
jgi:rhodanese-related sulfurtransferase